MTQLQQVVHSGQRILTTQQIAVAYEVEEKAIRQNFNNNKLRYEEGKHYYCLKNGELQAFKNSVENFDGVNKRTHTLYLWTERGAFLHAKSLNTDRAWEVYDILVDTYFRAKEKPLANPTPPSTPKQLEGHKYPIKYHDGQPVILVPDFNSITGIDVEKHPDYAKISREHTNGCPWTVWGEEYNNGYWSDNGNPKTVFFMYRSGVLIAIKMLNLHPSVSAYLLSLVPIMSAKRRPHYRPSPLLAGEYKISGKFTLAAAY